MRRRIGLEHLRDALDVRFGNGRCLGGVPSAVGLRLFNLCAAAFRHDAPLFEIRDEFLVFLRPFAVSTPL